MATLIQLPMRGKDIETRPIYIEEWLDALPYIDFPNTIQALTQALQALNAVPMKGNQRMELVTLFHRPYKYYLDTQIRSGAQHTLQTMEAMQSQLAGMKLLSVQLARASRLSVDDVLSHKSLWGQSKFPLQEILMSLTYLSHALIYSFLEYAPTPAKVWQEIHFLYQFAENINQHKTPVKPVATARQTSGTIEQRYKRIALIALSDPNHLPFGAVWEIHEQLGDWTEMVELTPFKPVADPSGYFVLNLNSDNSPLPYAKFNLENANVHYRLLDTNKLLGMIRQYINASEAKRKEAGLQFSSYYADFLLRIIEKAWGLPPKRYFPRKPKTGQIQLMHGINTTYYFLNGEKDFTRPVTDHDENTEEAAITTTSITSSHRAEPWSLVDTSGGGIAVTRDDKPRSGVRVGDIVAMKLDENSTSLDTFRAGILRWLLVRQGKIYKAGIQIINLPVVSAAIRASHGNHSEREFRRAILTGNPSKQKDFSVITNKGLYLPDRELEISFNGRLFKAAVSNMIESTTCFEQFNLKVQ